MKREGSAAISGSQVEREEKIWWLEKEIALCWDDETPAEIVAGHVKTSISLRWNKKSSHI